MKRLAIFAAIALSLSACATVGNVATNTPIVSLSATTTDEKAEALAWDGYLFCARTFNATKAAMDPALKERLRGLLQKAYPALQAAHSARLSANAPTFLAQLALANDAITQARAILPKGN